MGSTIISPVDKVPTGAILPFGGTSAPQGYLICDGNLYSSTDYPNLYAVIGSNFGSGGAGTFKVPALLSYYIKGADAVVGGLEPVGFTGGTVKGVHTHNIGVAGGALITGAANVGAQSGGAVANTLTQKVHTHTVVGATDNANTQPQFLCVNFIIKT